MDSQADFIGLMAPGTLNPNDTPQSTTSPADAVPLSAAQLKSTLASHLASVVTVSSKAAKKGTLAVAIRAPEAGTVALAWYQLPPGATLAAKSKKPRPEPVLVASGHASAASAAGTNVTMRFTAAGKRLLAHSKRLNLTARCTFEAAAGPDVTATKAFILTRAASGTRVPAAG